MQVVVSVEGMAPIGTAEGGEAGESGLKLPAPAGPADLADHYDLTISHPAVDAPHFVSFDRWLAVAAHDLGLSCALIHAPVVHEAVRRLGEGRLRIGYHLDYHALWHIAEDPYARLAEAVEDSGGRSVNPPARSRAFTDKTAAHAELARRGLGAPATVIVRPWTADRDLTAEERRRLRLEEPGARVYIKPANGFSGFGVVRVDRVDADGFRSALTAARNYDRREAYLVQREVRPPRLMCDDGCERPAYWRILSYLGELIPFWWGSQESVGPGRPSYRPLSREEIHRCRLQPLLGYTKMLGELSGLEWFSTELCLGDGADESRFTVTTDDGRERPVLAIDYLNDQCDVDVQSRWAGAAPDDVVRACARRFARTAWEAKWEKLRARRLCVWRRERRRCCTINGMLVGYNTNGFAHHRLEDAIVLLAELGYRSIALTLDYHALDPFDPSLPQQLAEVKGLLEKHGLRSVVETGARFLLDPRRKHQPTLLSPDPDRERRLDFLKRAVDVAAELGSDAVSFWSGTPKDAISPAELLDRLADGCLQLCRYAESRRMRLAFEPEPGMLIDAMDRFAELRDRVDHPFFGLTIDIGHLHCQGESPVSAHLRRWRDLLWNVHIEDMRSGVHDHLMFGEGEIDFREVLGTLKEIGYAGGVHVELSRHSHDAVETARRALAFLRAV